MKLYCENCSKKFNYVVKKAIYFNEFERDLKKSQKKDDNVYKNKRELIGYVCFNCKTLEIIQPYYDMVKKTIQLGKDHRQPKKQP